MATPTPFEPLWQADLGPIKRSGMGLLPPELSPKRDLLDRFTVVSGGHTVSVHPKTGEMRLGSRLVANAGPCRLLWFRRMSIEIGTHDPNHAPADCLWYGVGLENDTGRFGFRIVADGRIVEGLPA